MKQSSKKHELGTAALYCRLSRDDNMDSESNSIQNQELLCRGWFLPPNTYDCGSFVVNGTAVVGKEQNNPYTQQYTDFQLSAPSYRCGKTQYGQTCQSSQAGA